MKKLFFVSMMVVALALVAGPAWAATYMGKFDGNDKIDKVKAEILGYFGANGISHNYDFDTFSRYVKNEYNDGNFVISEGQEGGTLDLTFNADNKSGTWTAGTAIDFFTVKGGPDGYALYWVDPANSTGVWDTTDISNIDLSHMSTFTVSQVPIPGAAWLLGSGILGLMALRRRQQK